jgi:DNA repair exonuclease SbcCD ATPase subunit
MKRGSLTTGVDQLVELVNSKGKVSIREAAKSLGVSANNVEELALVLEKSGLVELQYALTKTYIVRVEMSKADLNKKAKEVESDKKTFENRNAALGSYLEKLDEELKLLEKLIKDTSARKIVPEELKKVNELETKKSKTDQMLVDVRYNLLKKIQEFDQRISSESKEVQSKMNLLLEQMEDSAFLIDSEDVELKAIEKNEKQLETQLQKAANLVDKRIEKLSKMKKPKVEGAEKRIKILKTLSKKLHKEIKTLRSDFKKILTQGKKESDRLTKLHNQIVSKIRKHKSKLYGSTPKEVERFLKKRQQHMDLLNKIYHEETVLKNSLLELMSNRKSLNPKKRDFAQEVKRLNKLIETLNDKRKVLEQDVKNLVQNLK